MGKNYINVQWQVEWKFPAFICKGKKKKKNQELTLTRLFHNNVTNSNLTITLSRTGL